MGADCYFGDDDGGCCYDDGSSSDQKGDTGDVGDYGAEYEGNLDAVANDYCGTGLYASSTTKLSNKTSNNKILITLINTLF